ncbi:MAG: protein-tyrosine phosphatase [Barrevirus sp.]|uniref:Protein-tyrosine phosphatase n=1 Tax=Barrevirus sp. TaxID=2487763 RepID=A0A3G4ZPS4_9VIRU|nr:MAG: protein-tyrosine phosphatase [Barrevirus sp.]
MKFNDKRAYCKYLKDDKDEMIQQFMALESDLTGKQYSDAIIYGDRNRFKNVLACNDSWPKITTGYINASYLLSNQFIATQYPIASTVDHFWTLLFESESNLVINLTGSNDYLSKSSKYTVSSIIYDNDPICECRQLTISKSSDNPCGKVGYLAKTIYYVNFKTWPDQLVPLSKDFEKLIGIVSILDQGKPMIVHCKAGIGRTGTFILAYHMLKSIKNGTYPDPIDLVKRMRSGRANMIQTDNQFIFALDFILTKISKKEKENTRKQLSSSFNCSNEFSKKLNCSANSLSVSQDSL